MADNHYKLYVQIGGGAYMCHRCGTKGSWFDFKRRLGGGATEVTSFSSPSSPQHTPHNNGYGGSKASGTAAGGGGKNGRSNHQQQGNMSQRNRNAQNNQDHGTHCLPMPSERLAAAYSSALLDAPSTVLRGTTQNQPSQTVLEYLTDTRGLSKATLRKYGVGKAIYRFPSSHQDGGYEAAECVTFPWILRASEIAEQETLRGATYQFEVEPPPSSSTLPTGATDESLSSSDQSMKHDDKDDGDEGREQVRREEGPWTTRRIKARAVSNKGWQRLDPAGGGWGLFGWHTVPSDATSIVICEGEYDAMAVYQATGKPAVSLPNGCRSLPVEVLPILEKFEEIYLWMDSDGPGQEGAEMFSKKIGLDRCLIVPTFGGCKDANEALLQHQDLNAMLEAAKVMPHESILQFDEIRSQVLHEIFHPDKYVGVPVPSLPSFTKLIKGFRRGEMTVLTGPTGRYVLTTQLSYIVILYCKYQNIMYILY
jgi:twinkle protein